MSDDKNRKKGKSKAGVAITTVLAIILITCTGLAIWTSVNPDAQRAGPLALLTATPLGATPEPETVAPSATPAPSAAPEVSPTPEVTPKPEPEASAEPAPVASAGTVEIKISAVGDITMGTEVMNGQRKFDIKAEEKGLDYFFSGVREILESDDLTIGNLEGPLTTAKSHRKGREFIFKGKPEYAKILVSGSVEAVTIANNHARDFFTKGQKDTQKALDNRGITWFGFNNTAVCEIKGVKVGLIGLTEWDYKEKGICEAIKALKEECDMVIVEIHWGTESRMRPSKKQKRLGHAAIDAGADAIFGHHTHVVGGIEMYKGRPIVYSLGNFCFAGNTDPIDKDTFIFVQVFTVGEGTVAAGESQVIPCSISSSKGTNDFRPVPLLGNRAKEVLEKIRKASKGFDQTLDFKRMADEIQKGA